MSATNGAGEPGDELDEIRLAVGPGLLVDVAKTGLDRLGGNGKCRAPPPGKYNSDRNPPPRSFQAMREGTLAS
jgi:hypothetical protein